MPKPKFDIFDLQSGEFDETKDAEEKLKKITDRLTSEADKLTELYKAEIEIVRSILEQAIEDGKNSRSTD